MPHKALRLKLEILPGREGVRRPTYKALLKKALALADEQAGKKKSNTDQGNDERCFSEDVNHDTG